MHAPRQWGDHSDFWLGVILGLQEYFVAQKSSFMPRNNRSGYSNTYMARKLGAEFLHAIRNRTYANRKRTAVKSA